MSSRQRRRYSTVVALPPPGMDRRMKFSPPSCPVIRHAQRYGPKELTPSLSGGALRGRIIRSWCGITRAHRLPVTGFLFRITMGWKVPLRSSTLAKTLERHAISVAGRPTDECREKASLLLLAFSPFAGDCTDVEQRKEFHRIKEQKRWSKCMSNRTLWFLPAAAE